MKTAYANIDYVCGHLKYGHLELNLTDKEYEEFKNLSEEEQKDRIKEDGALILDDYSVDDIGSIGKITIYGD